MSKNLRGSSSTWHTARLDEICDVILGQSPPGNTYNTNHDGLPFFQGKAEFGDYYPTPVKWCSAPTKIAEKEDVLISVRAPVGPTNFSPSRACIGRGLAALRPKDGIPSRYIFYAMRATVRNLAEKATGTTFAAVSGSTLRAHTIPLAPQGERELIVAEIEKQFTRLEAGVAALKRVQANLKRYRAAVLKAACEGKLVPAEAELARTEGRKYETGEQLLDRILQDRRKRAQGVSKEPAPHNILALPAPPLGWTWGSVAQISEIIVDCPHSTAKFVSDGEPCVDTTCIKPGRIVREDLRFVSKATYKERVARLTPQAGDIIYAREGTVGTAVVIPEDLTPCLGQRVMLMRSDKCVLPRFFEVALNSEIIRRQYLPKLIGSTVAHLNVADVKLLAIPLPPLAEQKRIVEEVERRLSVLEEMETAVQANLLRAARLRQAVLQRAFSGELIQ